MDARSEASTGSDVAARRRIVSGDGRASAGGTPVAKHAPGKLASQEHTRAEAHRRMTGSGVRTHKSRPIQRFECAKPAWARRRGVGGGGLAAGHWRDFWRHTRSTPVVRQLRGLNENSGPIPGCAIAALPPCPPLAARRAELRRALWRDCSALCPSPNWIRCAGARIQKYSRLGQASRPPLPSFRPAARRAAPKCNSAQTRQISANRMWEGTHRRFLPFNT